MALQIQSDVPLPEETPSDPIPWGDLQVNDSVVVFPPMAMLGLDENRAVVMNPTFLTMVQAHARERGLIMGCAFEARAVVENDKPAVRIWRTA